jgi:hypothetical protein
MNTTDIVRALIAKIDAQYAHHDSPYPARAGALEVRLEQAMYQMDEETLKRFLRIVTPNA